MSKNKDLRLNEPDIFPTNEVIAGVLGAGYGTYAKFLEGLTGLELENEWKYFAHCTKSWLARGQYRWTTMRGAKKEKVIYWLSACDGYFNVTVWFLGKNRMEILQSDVSEETKKIIRNAKVFGTNMNTFPVEFSPVTNEKLADIFTLIKYKKKMEAN